MSRKQFKRRAGSVVFTTIAGFFILLVVAGVGFSAASADSTDELAVAGAYGFDEETFDATRSNALAADGISDTSDIIVCEQSALATSSTRDISSGLKMIDDRERAERERIAAENAAAIERMKTQKAKQGVVSNTQVAPAAPAHDGADNGNSGSQEATETNGAQAADEVAETVIVDPQPVEYNLPAVDWTVGREQFLEEWTARIDAYLAGSPLAGYGSVFAEAAWDNGVDPRWSPAISNTESGKGSVCFRPCNAWGWGGSGWSDWDTAIRAHVAGLASGYGYSITMAAASAYCPPTATDWYNVTIREMALI